MRIRHRTPSIFSLSMVDVFCCALGCVLLLWLWNLRKAQDYQQLTEQQNQHAASLLADLTSDRDGAYLLLLELQGLHENAMQDKSQVEQELTRQKARVLALETQLSDAANRQALTSKDLEGLRAVLDNERKLAAELNREKITLQDRLKALQVLADRLPLLEKELVATQDREKEATLLARGREKDLLAALEREKKSGELIRTRDADIADLARRVQALTTDKATLEKAMAALEKMSTQMVTDRAALEKNLSTLSLDRNTLEKNLATLAGEKAALEKQVNALTGEKALLEKNLSTHGSDLRATQTSLTTSQTRVRELEKELAATIRTLLNLQDEKKTLEAQAARNKAASDSRFAGIELSGRRVVFLVDTSTSMIETADGRPFPEKWAGVVDTVVKVMQSLPELESFQLVLFSRDSLYPLGQPGEWLRFDPTASPDLVKRTLLDPRFKPDGGTNVYAGLENAFKLRARQMDTIYLFSDGLPSRGVGVDPQVAKTLSDTELARRLGDHVRKTLRDDWNRLIPNVPKVRIHSIGFFYDSPDVGAFLWALSRENNGNFVGMSRP